MKCLLGTNLYNKAVKLSAEVVAPPVAYIGLPRSGSPEAQRAEDELKLKLEQLRSAKEEWLEHTGICPDCYAWLHGQIPTGPEQMRLF